MVQPLSKTAMKTAASPSTCQVISLEKNHERLPRQHTHRPDHPRDGLFYGSVHIGYAMNSVATAIGVAIATTPITPALIGIIVIVVLLIFITR